MSTVPLELPLRANEAAAVAEAIYQLTGGRPLTDDLRNRLAGRLAALNLKSIEPHAGSLEKDPIHSSAFFLAVDAVWGGAPRPLLLHIALASSPSSALFPNPVLIGRMRPGGGREIVVNAIPFSAGDHAAVRTFVEQVNRAFLPRPQGTQAAIAVGNRHPEISLPAAFEAYRAIVKNTGANLASTAQLSAGREMATDEALAARGGENPAAAGHTRVSIRHLYHAGLWAAIRTGWREGWNAGADRIIISGGAVEDVRRSVEAAREIVRQAAGYTKFTTDTSRLLHPEADLRHPAAWSAAVTGEKFQSMFPAEERRWIESAFSGPFLAGDGSYQFDADEVRRLAVKFGASLKLNEELYDFIAQVKPGRSSWRAFDFEPSLDEAETLTTARELIFYLHWLRERGRPAQLAAPNLGFKKRQAYLEPLEELGARVAELAAVARHFNATLSIHSGSGKQPAVLELIGEATRGRVNYKIGGELQLHLFDLLAEQPAGSDWRALYERMVERCNRFAVQGAFGEESRLAARCIEMGRGAYLGDPARGRVDGNLFLICRLGHVVGSRDVTSPDGDHRFFKDKLDELPPDLVREVRRRNTEYVIWLASHLRG